MSGVKITGGVAMLALVALVTLVAFSVGPFPQSAEPGESGVQVRSDVANEEFERVVRHLCLEEYEEWGEAAQRGDAPRTWDPAGCRGMEGVPDGAVLGPPSKSQEEIEAMLAEIEDWPTPSPTPPGGS